MITLRIPRGIRPAGVLVILSAVVGIAVGVLFGWVEMLTAGILAVVLLVCAVPFLWGGRAHAITLRPARDRITAGTPTEAAVTVAAGERGSLPGRLDVPVGDGLVEFALPALRAGRTWSRTIEIPPRPRGVLRMGPVTTVRGDPIGLLRREFTHDEVREVIVHPRTVALPPLAAGLIRDLDGRPTRELADADMSFHAIREYVPGDARGHIHWKSTARTGRLMVRQFEQTRRSRMVVVVDLDQNAYAEASEFELAVSAAGSLGVRALDDAREVAVALGDPVRRLGRTRAVRHLDAPSRQVLLDELSTVTTAEAATPLIEVCAVTAQNDPELSIAVIVTGPATPLTRLRRAARVFPPAVGVLAVVCNERAHPRLHRADPVDVMTIGTLDDLAGLTVRAAAS